MFAESFPCARLCAKGIASSILQVFPIALSGRFSYSHQFTDEKAEDQRG